MPLPGALLLCLAVLPPLCAPLETEVVTPRRLDPHLAAGVVFQLRAFREDFSLRLRPDARFLAPAFATHYLGAPAGGGGEGEGGDLRRCFYAGEVNADPASFAALSLCGGLTGAFGYRGAEYLIRPLRNDSGNRALWHGRGEHLLQRRRAPAAAQPAATSRCGVGSGLSPAVVQALRRYQVARRPPPDETRQPAGRAKRFVSVPRFVETLVVADESMVKFHGGDLEHYLLTLMATAARLYRHASIQNPISIVVVKFLLIGQDDKGPKVTGNAALTLRNFCAWQKKWNKGSDKHPEYWDTAILFTKQVGAGREGRGPARHLASQTLSSQHATQRDATWGSCARAERRWRVGPEGAGSSGIGACKESGPFTHLASRRRCQNACWLSPLECVHVPAWGDSLQGGG